MTVDPQPTARDLNAASVRELYSRSVIQPLVWRCSCGQFNDHKEQLCMRCNGWHPQIGGAS